MNKIVFIHSLNNFTGSPNVLSVILKGFLAKGYQVDLITSRGEGFLSNMEGVNYRFTCYRWLNSKWQTAVLLILSQLQLFFRVLFSGNQNTIYYLNTITPFGAAWACRLSNKNFIYHVHENMQQDKPIYQLFRWTYRHCNRKSIFVSNYLKSTALNCREGIVIHNSLDANFIEKANTYREQNSKSGTTILMVASLRKFKGVFEFVELARMMPEQNFELVLSASQDDISDFFSQTQIPANLFLHASQNEMHPFYQKAKLLLQLSHPESWIETFGLTILEAMVYGVPSLVPNVGGPTELVTNGENGFLIDPHNLKDIKTKISQLVMDDQMCDTFSNNALLKSKQFTEKKLISGIENYIIK